MPAGLSLRAVLLGGAVWAGAVAGRRMAWWAIAGILVGLALSRRRVAAVLMVGVLAGAAAGWRSLAADEAVLRAAVAEGSVTVGGRLAADPMAVDRGVIAGFDPGYLLDEATWRPWNGPRLLLRGSALAGVAGDTVVVSGGLRSAPGRLRGLPHAGVLTARSIEVLGPENPLFAVGNALRGRVLAGLARHADRPGAGLLAGFLIGETSGVDAGDREALRRAGLSHFVAVSGSNVALFLAAWWIAAGPLGWGPRRRAIVGLAGLAVFVVVTRWEPSVVRAATMAAIVLGGRLTGRVVDAWEALGAAVTILVLFSARVVDDIGFQLSVAATAGVLLAAPLGARRSPRWLWSTLAATVGAQVAVAPILLARTGSIPLMAPVANLLAAPLVAVSTMVGGVGVLVGLGPAVGLGMAAADGVLLIARFSADLPQLGWAGAGLLGFVALIAARSRLRPLAVLVGAVVVAAHIIPQPGLPGGPLVEVLDVGQGDGVLLRDGAGAVILVDGGPDPLVLADHLRGRGIRRVDLLVVSHRHADHTSGLIGVTSLVHVVRALVPDQKGEGGPFDGLLAELDAHGIPVSVPRPGWSETLGSFHIEVLAPLRRYASPNDGSLVLMVRAAGRTVLLSGDIEVIAQRELGPLRADVMKVPHQGAATTDLAWLSASAPLVALISVGPNDFGHPSAEVIRILTEAGADVRRTDLEGDIAIRLDRLG